MSIRTPIHTWTATLGVLIVGLLLSSTPALALETDFKEAIGAGTLERGSRHPVAVNTATGDIYVRDAEAGAIVRFQTTGQLVGAFPGELLGELIMTVDNSSSPSAGNIYVASGFERFVKMFDPAGTAVAFKGVGPYINGSELLGTPTSVPGELAPFSDPAGVAVDGSGNIYVSDGAVIDVFNDEGEYQRHMTTQRGGPSALAIAEDGTVYVIESSAVEVYNPKGELERELTGTPTGPAGSFTTFVGPFGIAIDNSTSLSDPSAGDVYVADKHVVDVFNAGGEYQSQIVGTPSGPFGVVTSVATDADGDIYASDNVAGVVDVFTPTFVTVPDAVTGPASNVGHTSATVIGGIDPDGLDATCFVEYGAKLSVPCLPSDVGSGSEEVQVLANLTGLSPRSTTYSYRVCGLNENNIPHCGKAKSFTTLPDKPTITSESGESLSPREASLNGSLNPETGATTYHFAYGPTSSYGQRFPSADQRAGTGEASIPVNGFSIGGLQPGETYHYALVATNAAGTTYGPDQTFTTPAGSPPAVGTGDASAISQQAASVSGVVDPEGVPTTYEFDLGTDTSYGTRVFGSAGAGVEVEPFVASFQSLLPNTTYHYRLLATNTYGTTYGADETFTTPGFASALPGAPSALALVAIPNVAFPSESGATTTTTKKALTNAQKLAAALKTCKKDKSKSKRASCEKKARRTYGKAKK